MKKALLLTVAALFTFVASNAVFAKTEKPATEEAAKPAAEGEKVVAEEKKVDEKKAEEVAPAAEGEKVVAEEKKVDEKKAEEVAPAAEEAKAEKN